MATVKKKFERLIGKKPMIKFVKKAAMWCCTTWNEDGVQKQDWSMEKPFLFSYSVDSKV